MFALFHSYLVFHSPALTASRLVKTSNSWNKAILYCHWTYKLLQNIIRSKGGEMDMTSLMGGIKDRTSKEFLVMQSFQLEKTWVRLSWPWQTRDGLYSTLLERHEWCRTWCAQIIRQFYNFSVDYYLASYSSIQVANKSIYNCVGPIETVRWSPTLNGLSHGMWEFFRIQLQTNFCPLTCWWP